MKTYIHLANGPVDRENQHANGCLHQTRVSRLDRDRFSAAWRRNRDGRGRIRSGRALTLLLVAVSTAAVLAASLLFAQSPPLPSAPVLRPVTVAWDAQPASEHYTAVDGEGNFVGITYRVYNATNVTGPWTVVATTTNLSATLSNLTARTQFFYVTASNFFLESEASRILSIPRDRVPLPRLLIGE